MNKDDIQKLKIQLGETRRWFYLGAHEAFGVDITGIPLPRMDITVSGGFQNQVPPAASYDYLEETEFDRQQREAQMEKATEDTPTPKIYLAMGKFLNTAVQYLEMRQDIAEGEKVQGMPTKERNLEQALNEVENAAKFPPFPEAKAFVENIAHHAQIAHILVTSDKPISYEGAELKLEQRLSNGR